MLLKTLPHSLPAMINRHIKSHHRFTWLTRFFIALTAMTLLSACGQKGPLKLPDAPKADSRPAVQH
jgi:predicted small lipoprotein YifL